MSGRLHLVRFGAPDAPLLWDYLRRDVGAALFAIADLEHFGWHHPELHFTGILDGERMVGYAMRYSINGCIAYDDPAAIPLLAGWLRDYGIRYINALERHAKPLMAALPHRATVRCEASTLAWLPEGAFNPAALQASPGRAWRATLDDVDGAARAHAAAPDEFVYLDFHGRRAALRNALSDGWRRLFVAATPEGQIVAAAQTSAEAHNYAIIGGVVTDPAHRGHGYSTACTAALSAELLAEGKTPYLFYRTNNIPAARVYARIGYQSIEPWILAELDPYFFSV